MTEPVTRDETLKLLRTHKAALAENFGIASLALFGSTVRGESKYDSAIDILVWFVGRADWRRYFGVQSYLENLLGRPVDLVNEQGATQRSSPIQRSGGRGCLVRSRDRASGVSLCKT